MNLLEKLRRKKKARATKRKIAAYEQQHRLEDPGERPAPLPVEETFDAFVSNFGGEKISDRLDSRASMPLNADYIFPKQNVIAELKTLEGVFSGSEGMRSLQQVFIDAGESPALLMDVLMNRADVPERAAQLMRKRLRRGLEDRISKARRQLRMSKSMFGDANTRSLILFAMDSDPLFGHQTMINSLAILMGSNFRDEHVDGLVYFNPNMPTRVTPDGMEFQDGSRSIAMMR